MIDVRATRTDRCTRHTRRGVRVTVLTALLVVAAGCGRQPGSQTEVATPTPAAPQGATLAIAGTLFNGSDPDQIRAYLQTVQEIKPIKFDVQWSPATVPVSKQEAMRSLLSVSRDGSTFRFARAEPVVGRIKPGSILWIYDLAVAHVDSVDANGDIVVVHTSPASLTQMFTHADIEFDAAPNLQNLYVAFRPHLPPAAATTSAPTASIAAPHSAWFAPAISRPVTKPVSWLATSQPETPQAPRLMPAVWHGGAGPALLRVADNPPPDNSSPDSSSPDSSAPDSSAPDSSAPDNHGDDPDGDYGVTLPQGHSMTGKIKGFEYSIGYTTTPDHLSLELQARKGDEGNDSKPSGDAGDKAKEMQQAAADLQKQLHKLADLKGQQLTAQTALNDMESEYNREMTHLDSSISDPQDRARAQQSATVQYQRQRTKLQDELVASDKARATVSKIKADDEERLKQWANAKAKLKDLFGIISDNLDVRFRAKADVSNFRVASAIKVTDGKMDGTSMQFKNLKGRIHIDFIGRMGQPGNGAVKIPVAHLPYVFNIPCPIDGLPVVVQLGGDFKISVFLAGKHATEHFSGDYEFSGTTGFKATPSGTNDQTAMSGNVPEVSKTEAMSPGVSGLVLAIQAPRVGVGLGAFGASSIAYTDVVSVITMTNAAAANGAAMFSPLCQRTDYSAVGSVGVDTRIMPLPVPFVGKLVNNLVDKLNKKLSTRKQVFEHHREVLNPPVKACEV